MKEKCLGLITIKNNFSETQYRTKEQFSRKFNAEHDRWQLNYLLKCHLIGKTS